MYKLIILVQPQSDLTRFEARWPEFLAAAERMPGLRREVTSHVDRVLHGDYPTQMVHELYFDTLKAAAEAMGTPEGEAAGKILQEISGGKVTLLLADHNEDELNNIRRFQPPESNLLPGDRA
jgi:uncharacterized protein (TIGR02118 family)